MVFGIGIPFVLAVGLDRVSFLSAIRSSHSEKPHNSRDFVIFDDPDTDFVKFFTKSCCESEAFV